MNKDNGFRRGMGIAFRLGTELTVATMLGAVMGYALDRFLNTKPWFMVAGVIFGSAAGCLNVYRAAQEISISENNENDKNE